MSVSITMVRALIDALENAGVDRAQLLTRVGIAAAQLDDGDSRLTWSDYAAVQRAALELSADPALGLHLGERAIRVNFDVIGPLTDNASSLRQSIQTIIRYSKIISPEPECELHEHGEIASIRFGFPREAPPEVRLTAEFALSGLLHLLRRFAGHRAMPRAVRFRYAAPDYRVEYARIFGGRECFEQDFTGIDFDRAWLDLTQLHKNAELYAVLETQAERKLGRLEQEGRLAARIEDHLAAQNPRHLPAMHEVARHFGMSARSLRRRLSIEGVAYKVLVDRARRQIAERLLENRSLSIQEAAYAMGFATPAAFHRAFKRWTDTTPTLYRASR